MVLIVKVKKRGADSAEDAPAAKAAKVAEAKRQLEQAQAALDEALQEDETAEETVEETVEEEWVEPEYDELMEQLMEPGPDGASVVSESGAARQHEEVIDLEFGYVKDINMRKGFTMLTINPEDPSPENDVFVHESVCWPSEMEKVQAVAYKVHVNARGSKQASGPVWLLRGAKEGEVVSWGEYTGIVGTISEKTGSTFLQCDEAKEKFNKDVYAHSSILKMGDLRTGETVSFNVHVNPKGEPQLSTPIWKCHDKISKEAAEMAEWGATGSTKGSAKGAKGWGESGDGYGSTKGGAKGWGGDWSGATDWWGSAASSGKAGGSKADGKGKAVAGPSAPAESMSQSLNLKVGEITSCDEGYALVALTDGPQDVHLGSEVCDIESLQPGQYVAVSMESEGGSRASAPCYKLFGSTEFLTKGIWMGRNLGTVRRIAGNGNAWIDSGATQAKYGADGFVHSSIAGPAALQENDRVAFNIHENKDGMPQVSSPIWKLISEDDQPIVFSKGGKDGKAKGKDGKASKDKGGKGDDWGKGSGKGAWGKDGKGDWGKGDWGKGGKGDWGKGGGYSKGDWGKDTKGDWSKGGWGKSKGW